MSKQASHVINVDSLKLTRDRRILLISACLRLTVFRECCATKKLIVREGGGGQEASGNAGATVGWILIPYFHLLSYFYLRSCFVFQKYIIILLSANICKEKREDEKTLKCNTKTKKFLHFYILHVYMSKIYRVEIYRGKLPKLDILFILFSSSRIFLGEIKFALVMASRIKSNKLIQENNISKDCFSIWLCHKHE